MAETVGIFQDCMRWEETAAMIPCSPEHLRQDHKEIGVPSVRIGGKIYFIKGEVEDWLRKRAYAHRSHEEMTAAVMVRR